MEVLIEVAANQPHLNLPNPLKILETTSKTSTLLLCFASEIKIPVIPALIDAKVVPAPARAANSHLPPVTP
jgi:hypothetical protein